MNGGYYPAPVPHALALPGNRSTSLLANPATAMRVSIWYRLTHERTPRSGLWNVETVAYVYAIEDDAGTEILTYHWHPEARSPVMAPHVHLEAASGVTRPRLLGAHLPTGHITLAQFIRCLIEELGVESRRADWHAVLEHVDAAG